MKTSVVTTKDAAIVVVMSGMLTSAAAATEHAATATGGSFEAPAGLLIPEMSAERGRALFAEKACVVCHAVNDIGGHHTPLDAETMDMPMNAFEFAAKSGAEPSR
jgi:mono/diheme cytochrome c family protein